MEYEVPKLPGAHLYLQEKIKPQTVDFCTAAQWQQKANPQLVVTHTVPLKSDDDVSPLVLLTEGTKKTNPTWRNAAINECNKK